VTGGARRARAPLVLKLGGELLEEPRDLARIARHIVALSKRTPTVVVHGGGREIDVALAAAGIPKRQVDGLRVTDEATLAVVVGVLAGTINTRLVAAVRKAGGRPVGLTGADVSVVTVKRAAPVRAVAGGTVNLGLVGTPVGRSKPQLLLDLLADGYVPVVACVGATRRGELLNVNADTLASHLARALGAKRLVIAGGTSGVLDERGLTIQTLTDRAARQLVRVGIANKGMVAKLEACRDALRGGVQDVVIANGRRASLSALASSTTIGNACTRVVP
jgi:acetylglutamate kinase